MHWEEWSLILNTEFPYEIFSALVMYTDNLNKDIGPVKFFFLTWKKYMKRWRPFYQQFWCRGYGREFQKTTHSLVMSISHASSIYDGSYRCVSHAKNVTAQGNSSQVLAIKVQCE